VQVELTRLGVPNATSGMAGQWTLRGLHAPKANIPGLDRSLQASIIQTGERRQWHHGE
jgi:hypothetical protein